MKPLLIYSGGGNPRFYKIAIEIGFKYGVQFPDTAYGPVHFADQNWKKPDRKKYMHCLSIHKPNIATVIDFERQEQFTEVMDWAEEASQYVDIVQIIPKAIGQISKIPRRINRKDIMLGYSVPTKYGKTNVPLEEFRNWNIHLLGGSPTKQFEFWEKLKKISNVYSVDGNYYRFKATKFCEYYGMDQKWHPDGRENPTNAPYIVFKKSCENIVRQWETRTKNDK